MEDNAIGGPLPRRGRLSQVLHLVTRHNTKVCYDKGVAPSTECRLHHSVAQYERILNKANVRPFPITTETLLEFIALFALGRRGSTVRRHVLELGYIAILSGYGDPAHDPLVCEVLDDLEARSEIMPRRPCAPEDIQLLLRKMPERTMMERRCKAVVILTAVALLSPSEIRTLRAGDARLEEDGSLYLGRVGEFDVHIRPGTSPETDPVTPLLKWLGDFKGLDLPLIPCFDSETLTSSALGRQRIQLALREATKEFLGRSLSFQDVKREILITLANRGVSMSELMTIGRYRRANHLYKITGRHGAPFSIFQARHGSRRMHDA